MECVNIVDIHTVNALRRLEPHVVVARIVVLPECSHWHEEQWAGFLTQSLNELVLAGKRAAYELAKWGYLHHFLIKFNIINILTQLD